MLLLVAGHGASIYCATGFKSAHTRAPTRIKPLRSIRLRRINRKSNNSPLVADVDSIMFARAARFWPFTWIYMDLIIVIRCSNRCSDFIYFLFFPWNLLWVIKKKSQKIKRSRLKEVVLNSRYKIVIILIVYHEEIKPNFYILEILKFVNILIATFGKYYLYEILLRWNIIKLSSIHFRRKYLLFLKEIYALYYIIYHF